MAAPRTITRQALFAEKMPEGHARHQSSNTAIANFERGAKPGARDQSEDSREVAEAAVCRGSEDRTEGATLDCSQRGR